VNLRPWGLARIPGRLRLLAVIPVVVAFAFVVTGCDKLTGGGWIPSLAPSLALGQKATFGFNARCKNTTVDGAPFAVLYEGQFEFDDHAANPLVRVHGDVEPMTLAGRCEDFPGVPDDFSDLLALLPAFSGTYRTQPSVVPSLQGNFVVKVFDGGEPGKFNDFICVTLSGGLNYTNCDFVQGGNIQVQ
jgi:hypothetical protein